LEKYKNGYIFYSLGNFIFDQMWSEPTQEGLMVKMVFNKNQILQLEPLPIYINKSYQPALANQKISEKIFSILNYPLEKQSKYFWTNENFKLSVSQGIYNKFESCENKYQSFDLDSDGSNEEAVVIDKVGYLIKDNKIIWKTEESWIVDNVLIGDFNNDQKSEVGFSLWKEGSYGPSKPFWVKDNDTKISNHLFLYQLELDKLSSLSSFKMIWGSSALDFPIKEMKLGDFDNDGKNELAVLESNCGRYEQKCEKNNLGIWRWGNFSFYNIFKGEVGKSIDFFFFGQ